MRIYKNKLYAVVTGDVVSSSRLSVARRKAMHAIMLSASRATRKVFGKALPADVDIFSGDSWQMLAADPVLVLRMALFYRASLRSGMESHAFDTRMSIAIATVDFVPGNRVSEGDGSAFRLSGQALEDFTRSETAKFLFPASEREKELDVMVQLLDRMVARWSDKQSLAATGALQGWNQEKIASTCWPDGISQQAVAQHLNRAEWNTIERALIYIEEAVAAEIEANK